MSAKVRCRRSGAGKQRAGGKSFTRRQSGRARSVQSGAVASGLLAGLQPAIHIAVPVVVLADAVDVVAVPVLPGVNAAGALAVTLHAGQLSLLVVLEGARALTTGGVHLFPNDLLLLVEDDQVD